MRLLRAITLLTIASAASAADVKDMQLVSYVRRSLSSCPGNNVKLETSGEIAPAGFTRYLAQQSSTDPRCGRRADVLVHKPTGSVIIGDVFPLPIDPRRVEARVSDLAGRILRKQVQVTVDSKSFPDGTRRANVITGTKYGPFAFGGYVDQSNRFFIVGRRGNLKTDPGKSLLESLQVSTGAHMGTKGAPITIVELSDLQCPTCRRAHDSFEQFLKRHASKISYTRLDLPLFESHDWTMPAALAARAIWKVAPEKYWSFIDYIFDHQQEISAASVSDVIRDWVEGNGISMAKFEPVWKAEREVKALLEHTGRVYDNSISSTPTFIVNGQVVAYGGDGEYLRAHLESLLASASKPPAKPAAKKAAPKKAPTKKKSN